MLPDILFKVCFPIVQNVKNGESDLGIGVRFLHRFDNRELTVYIKRFVRFQLAVMGFAKFLVYKLKHFGKTRGGARLHEGKAGEMWSQRVWHAGGATEIVAVDRNSMMRGEIVPEMKLLMSGW